MANATTPLNRHDKVWVYCALLNNQVSNAFAFIFFELNLVPVCLELLLFITILIAKTGSAGHYHQG
jgi:hypothetical protein